MAKVNELAPRAAKEVFKAFVALKKGFKPEETNFVLFYGNPTETEISWCPDCRISHAAFIKFVAAYSGSAAFHMVPVGPRQEFNEGNPFRRNHPGLEGVPTLVIYKERITYLKLVDPSFEDLVHFVKKFGL